MALVAHLTQDGTMDICVHDGGFFRPVGIVTGSTPRLCNRVTAVLPCKRGVVRLVTVCAQFGHIGFQKMPVFFGRVRVMAVETPLLDGRVFEPGLRYRLPKILVTTEAEFVPRFHEVPLVVRRMGIMATGAFAIDDNLVRAFRFFRRKLLMATEAYPGGIGLQQFPVGGGVGIMATGTFPFFYWCMEEGALELFLEVHVAVCADLPFRAGLETVHVGRVRRGGGQKNKDEKDAKRNPIPHVRALSLHFFSPATWHSPQERDANGGCVTSLKNFRSVDA
jgi:hypothetical protein